MSASTLCVSARCRKGEKQMACAYVVCTVKHGGGGVVGLVTLLTIIHISWQYIPSWLPQHPAGKHPPIWFVCNSRFFSLNSQKKGTIDQNREWVVEVNRGGWGSGTEFHFTLTWWLYIWRKASRQIFFLSHKSFCIMQALSFTSDFSFWINVEFIGTSYFSSSPDTAAVMLSSFKGSKYRCAFGLSPSLRYNHFSVVISGAKK